MRKILHWLFGYNSLWCRITHWCYDKKPDPVPPPTPPTPPPPEYKEVTVCELTGKLPTRFCLFRQKLKFVKGNEPTETCKSHDYGSFPDAERQLGFGGSMFLWFLREAWEEENFKETMYKALITLVNFRQRKHTYHNFFGWIRSNERKPNGDYVHAHINDKIPWELGPNKEIYKNSWNERYFFLLREFYGLHKLVGIEPRYCGLMDGAYNKGVFKKILNEEYFPYYKKLYQKVCATAREVYSVDYKPAIYVLNEGRHRVKGMKVSDAFHIIGKLHKAVWDAVSGYTKISKISVDLTKSEGPQIYLNEPLKCPKCDGVHGDPDHDRANRKKSIRAQIHGIAHIKNLAEWQTHWKPGGGHRNPMKWLGSRWAEYEYSGDGGAGFPTEGFHIPGTKSYAGSSQELYDLSYFMFKSAKDKGKYLSYCHWPFEVYSFKTADNFDWRENWDPLTIRWELVTAIRLGYEKANK